MDFLSNPILFFLALVVLIYSAILHEIAHGYIADRLGDPTARLMGRITLNPIPHIDPMLSVAVPLLLLLTGSPIIFGGAKPVPVDVFNLRDGRKDMAIVALAGPLTNVALAIIAAVLLKVFFPQTTILTGMTLTDFIAQGLNLIMRLNISLAIFNLLPIPPLDGSKVFSLILPEREAIRYLSLGSMGMFILFFLLLVPIGPFSLQNFISTVYLALLGLLGF
jgi:Zn-dependent protease